MLRRTVWEVRESADHSGVARVGIDDTARRCGNGYVSTTPTSTGGSSLRSRRVGTRRRYPGSATGSRDTAGAARPWPKSRTTCRMRTRSASLPRWRRPCTTNAILEGLKSVIQSIKRGARGFRNAEYLEMMIFVWPRKLDVSTQTSPASATHQKCGRARKKAPRAANVPWETKVWCSALGATWTCALHASQWR